MLQSKVLNVLYSCVLLLLCSLGYSCDHREIRDSLRADLECLCEQSVVCLIEVQLAVLGPSQEGAVKSSALRALEEGAASDRLKSAVTSARARCFF